MRFVILFVAAILLSVDADAWNRCESFAAADVADASVKPTGARVACHDTTSTGASRILSVAACDHFSVHLDPDVTSTGTGCEANVYRCTQANTTSCIKVMADTDGDGIPNDVTLTGDGTTALRNGYDWQSGAWIYVNVTANPSGHSCRTLVECK